MTLVTGHPWQRHDLQVLPPKGMKKAEFDAAAKRGYIARAGKEKWKPWEEQEEYVRNVWRRVARAVLVGETK